MVMVAESVPGLKRWVATLGLKDSAKLLVIRLVVTFLLHAGRMSCLRAAGVLRCEARHRAQISRLLARLSHFVAFVSFCSNMRPTPCTGSSPKSITRAPCSRRS